MKVWYEYSGEIPLNTIKNWNKHLLENSPWQYIGWTGLTKEPYRHWAAYPPLEGELKNIWDCINDSFILEGFNLKPERIIMNLYSHGDSSWLHRDGDKECWTAILFLNDFWDINWGGDFVIVDNNEILKAFSATPGKFILFRGDYLHAARPVSREAPYPRFSIAFQCDNNLQDIKQGKVSSFSAKL